MKFRTYAGAQPGISQVMQAIAAPGGNTYNEAMRDFAYVDAARANARQSHASAALDEDRLVGRDRSRIAEAFGGLQLPPGMTREGMADLYRSSDNANMQDVAKFLGAMGYSPGQREAISAGQAGDVPGMNRITAVLSGDQYQPYTGGEYGTLNKETGTLQPSAAMDALTALRGDQGEAQRASARASDAMARQRGYMEVSPGASLYDITAQGGAGMPAQPPAGAGVLAAMPGAPAGGAVPRAQSPVLDALPGALQEGVAAPVSGPGAIAAALPGQDAMQAMGGPRLVATAPGKPQAGTSLRVNADGTVEFSQGGSPISTATQNKVDDKIISSGDTLSQLNSIRQKFRPEFQEIGTRLGAKWSAIKSKVDRDAITPDERQLLREFSSYRSDAARMFSLTLKELSGAAVTPPEMKRAEGWLPNPGTGLFDGDSPIELEEKLNNFEDFTKKALMRYHYIRNHGLDLGAVSLDQMPSIMNQRGDAIMAEMIGQGMPGPQAREATLQQLGDEFGLVAY